MTLGPIILLEALFPTSDNGCHVVGIYIIIIIIIITMTVIKRSVRSIPLRE